MSSGSIEEAALDFLATIEKDLDKIPEEYLIEEIHRLVDYLQEKNNIKEEIQCGKQECSFCCYDDILITPLEAEHIKKSGVAPNTSLQTIQKNSHNFRQLAFAQKACIYLKDGRCSIYFHRPLVCKLHNILKGQDPQKCIVDETGHTLISNNQVFMVNTQALMYYIVGREVEELKSIYKYEW